MTIPETLPIPPCMPSEIAYASVSQPLEPALQGRSSPSRPTRQRRSHRSSTDEPVITPDGFTEEDLRAGGPHLCESPCHTFNWVPRNHHHHPFIVGDRGNELVSELTPICESAGLNLLETRLCGRRCAFETNAQPALTFLVLDLRPSISMPERGWIPLARNLRHYLESKDLGDINVEITDARFFQRERIFPCKPRDKIFHVWEDVATEIMGAIDLTGVCTIGCFRVGVSPRRKECPPTVLFGVDRDTQRDWKVVRETAVRVLDEHGLTDVAVLVRKDAGFRTVDDERSLQVLADTVNRCTKHASVGSSVSLHDSMDDRYGTLGGWLELKDREDGDWVPFAITCSHCVFPLEHGLSGSDCQALQSWNHTVIPVADETAARLLNSIDSPSQRDLRDAIQDLNKNINSLKEDATYSRVEDAKSRNESVTPSDTAKWKLTADIIAEQRKTLRVVSDFLSGNHHTLGPVFASSGLQEVPSKRNPSELSIRDWALIKDRDGRCPEKNTFDDRSLPFSQLYCLRPDVPLVNTTLHKVGRSTGFSSARYGGLRVAHITTRVVNGQHLETLPAWEYAFVAGSRSLTGHVVGAGDSGALVFDLSGCVVGLLFGGSFAGDVGYFTHILDLVEHIKMVTGVVDVRLRGSIV